MQKTNIEYLDYTWNPIAMRCTPCSPGCDNCWHLRTADRLKNNLGLPDNERKALAGEGPFVLRERELEAPLRLKKPAVIGVQFMGDLYHEDVPDEFIDNVMSTIALCQYHTFLILTKRASRVVKYFKDFDEYILDDTPLYREAKHRIDCEDSPDASINYHKETARLESDISIVSKALRNGGGFPNVWHGLTVCNQQEADEKIPELLKVPGKKWLSIEPMLGPVSVCQWMWYKETVRDFPQFAEQKIHAVILGGETSTRARPMHPDWVRSVRDQCIESGTAYFFKQWGEWGLGKDHPDRITKGKNTRCVSPVNGEDNAPHRNVAVMVKVGPKRAGRLLDGKTYDALPWRTACVE